MTDRTYRAWTTGSSIGAVIAVGVVGLYVLDIVSQWWLLPSPGLVILGGVLGVLIGRAP